MPGDFSFFHFGRRNAGCPFFLETSGISALPVLWWRKRTAELKLYHPYALGNKGLLFLKKQTNTSLRKTAADPNHGQLGDSVFKSIGTTVCEAG